MMKNESASWLDTPVVRFSLLVLVVVLLNLGLFFILNFLAPLVTGVVIGFLVGKTRDAMVISLIGTALTYVIVFLISEWILGFANTPLDVAIAVLIMSLIGTAGGVVGSFISPRTRN